VTPTKKPMTTSQLDQLLKHIAGCLDHKIADESPQSERQIVALLQENGYLRLTKDKNLPRYTTWSK
jgi:hypothetical protein